MKYNFYSYLQGRDSKKARFLSAQDCLKYLKYQVYKYIYTKSFEQNFSKNEEEIHPACYSIVKNSKCYGEQKIRESEFKQKSGINTVQRCTVHVLHVV